MSQLETEFRVGNFNLQKMFFYIQRNLQNMHLMSSIATTINKVSVFDLKHPMFIIYRSFLSRMLKVGKY